MQTLLSSFKSNSISTGNSWQLFQTSNNGHNFNSATSTTVPALQGGNDRKIQLYNWLLYSIGQKQPWWQWIVLSYHRIVVHQLLQSNRHWDTINHGGLILCLDWIITLRMEWMLKGLGLQLAVILEIKDYLLVRMNKVLLSTFCVLEGGNIF